MGDDDLADGELIGVFVARPSQHIIEMCKSCYGCSLFLYAKTVCSGFYMTLSNSKTLE